jgi:tetratricopeptide (TPR) repeat protein
MGSQMPMRTVRHIWSQVTKNASNPGRIKRFPFKLMLLLVSVLAWNVSIRPETINHGVVRLEPNSGITYEAEIAAGESRNFSLVLGANEFAQITINQQGIDLATSIRDPKNKVIHKSDWRWSGTESVSWVANSRGPYKIQVSARRRSGVPGKFALMLLHRTARTDLDPKWTAAERVSTQIKEEVDKGALQKLGDSIQDALGQWQQLNYRPGMAQILNVRGFVETVGRPLAARETLQQALTLRRSEKDPAGVGETLNNLAAAESAAGEIRKARDIYQEALSVKRDARDLEGLPSTLSNLGYIYWSLGESDEAITVLGDAIQASLKVADSRGEAQARINLGATLAAVGETEDALAQFRSALSF